MLEKGLSMQEIDKENLTDISKIEVDTSKTVEERIKEYKDQVKDPALIRVGEYVVKICHEDCEETLKDRMKEYLQKLGEVRW